MIKSKVKVMLAIRDMTQKELAEKQESDRQQFLQSAQAL